MNNATLLYRISYNNNYDDLRLENRSLFLIDRITSSFKNDEDFINHYYNKNVINDFIKKHNNKKGNIVIDYRKDINDKQELLPIYNQENIVYKDDSFNNKLSELEKARKLLFNSKNQIFTKLLLNSKLFEKDLYKMVDLDEEETKFAISNNLELAYINNKYYISFKSLFSHRMNSIKLGTLRNAYQDMLDVLKDNILRKDSNTLYFYNREIRLLIKKYYDLVNEITISNLKIGKIKNNKYLLCKE